MRNLYLPRIVFGGKDALERFANYLKEERVGKVFIVTDNTLAKIGLLKTLTGCLRGFKIDIFKDVEAEPSIETVEKLCEKIIEFKPRVIIALGGGSVIDAAKGGWVRYEKPDFNLRKISPFRKIGTGRKASLASIPTTSGTGSEVTLGIVYSIYRENRKEKVARGSYELVSNIVVLDPRFVINMPRELTMYTALDALSHATEALVSSTANDFTDALAEKVILNIFEVLPKLLKDLKNIELREQMHLTAMMAGMSFSNCGLGLSHGIAHIIGGIFHIHHGRAVAVTLPYIVKFNSQNKIAVQKYGVISKRLYREGLADDEPLHIQIRRFIQTIGGDVKYENLVDKNKYFDEMNEYINMILRDPDVIYNPIKPNKDIVKALLNDIYYGKI